MLKRIVLAVTLGIVGSVNGAISAQKAAGPTAGTLIIDGGGATEPVVRRFVEIAGGPRAKIVVVATGPSAIRFGDQNTVVNPDWPRERKEWSSGSSYSRSSGRQLGRLRCTALRQRRAFI